MTLGIDIDDTITNSSEIFFEYAKKVYNSTDIILINNLLHGHNITSDMLDFYDKYLLEILSKVTIKNNVKEVIDRFHLKGYKIILITARGYEVKAGQEKITREFLKKHNIKYDKIVFKARDKTTACIDNNVDLMIDDSVKVLEKLKSSKKVLLFNSISNSETYTDIFRVNTWLELEECINRMVKDGSR